jgi:poly(ADP-ribose) glycohydrolase ARH3
MSGPLFIQEVGGLFQMSPPSLLDRFVGSLLGLAVGDGLGAQFEGQSGEYIQLRLRLIDRLIDQLPADGLYYTDDTQMAIGVAETLVACKRVDEEHLCRRFAENYVPHRGYGLGARAILDAMLAGRDHREIAAKHFPGGSYGNGAAMRVAPVGLMFRHRPDELWEQARLSALPTHRHPLGIEGAQVLARAVGLASTATEINRERFFGELAERCEADEYRKPLRRAAKVTSTKDLALFGNGIEATASVVTAIACFGLTPDSYEQTIGNAIFLGGDTDTIAAMAGAISGAYLGRHAIPPKLLKNLEDKYQGKGYIEDLAIKLHAAHESIA